MIPKKIKYRVSSKGDCLKLIVWGKDFVNWRIKIIHAEKMSTLQFEDLTTAMQEMKQTGLWHLETTEVLPDYNVKINDRVSIINDTLIVKSLHFK